MFTPLFWFFAALTLLFGIGVVVNRNPVASALSLVVCFMGLAALFVGLDAYLIGVLQVLVYAGAVMVLFLFIIMLLDLRAEKRRKFNFLGVVGGGLVTVGFISQLIFVLAHNPTGNVQFHPLQPAALVQTEGVGTADAGPVAALASVTEVGIQPAAAVVNNGEATNGLLRSHPSPSAVRGEVDDVRQIGWTIFSRYNLPLQVIAVLILVATVGVVILSKRELL